MKTIRSIKFLKSKKFKIIAPITLVAIIVLCIFAGSQQTSTGDHDHDYGYDSNDESELNQNNNGTQDAKITLRVALSAAEGDIHYEAAQKFKSQVEGKSKGAIQVVLYGSGELGMDKAIISTLQENNKVADIVISEVSNFTGIDERMDISSLPFLFDSYDEAWSFMEGTIQKEIENSLIDKNIRVLAHYTNGFDYLTTTKKVVTDASDLVGLTIATANDDYAAIAARAMNANVVVVEEKKVYQGLRKNQYDGYMGSLDSIYEEHIYQIQESMTMTYHSYDAMAFAISEKLWKTLDKEYQEIISDAAIASAYADKEMVRQQQQELVKTMQSYGIKVFNIDVSSFKEKAEPVIRGYSSKYGSLIEKL